MSDVAARGPRAHDLGPGVRFTASALAALESGLDGYDADGWVLVPGLFSRATVERLRAAVDRACSVGATLTRDAVVRGAKFQVQSASGRPDDGAIEPGALRKITFPRALDRAFARLVHEPRLVEVARRLGVSSPRCAVDQINVKRPRVGTRFPWHQDLAFLGRRDRERIARWGGVNALVALDDADEGNGAFQVLPGSHRGGLVAFEYDLGRDTPAAFPGAGAPLTLRMRAGDAVFFSPLLAHGSPGNPSDRPRRMLAFWFVGEGGGGPGEEGDTIHP